MSEVGEKGWLWKQGFNVKNWKLRYFILHVSYLEYFEAESDTPALGTIPLGMVVIYMPFKQETDRLYSFALQTPDRTYYLASESESDMKRWVDAIKLSIQDIFVTQVNHHLPTAQAYAEPTEKKESGMRALKRQLTKRLLKEPKESDSQNISITSPTSTASTLSDPNPPQRRASPTPPPRPSSPTPPVTDTTVPVSPSSSPSHASDTKVVEAKQKDNRSQPRRLSAANRTAPALPPRNPPSTPTSTPTPSRTPPPLPARVIPKQPLVRPIKPPVLPPTPKATLAPPPTPARPLSPLKSTPNGPSLQKSPSSNLGPEKREVNTTATTVTNVTHGNSTTYNIQSVDNLVINNNIVIHCPPSLSPAPNDNQEPPTNPDESEGKIDKRGAIMLGSKDALSARVVNTMKKFNFTVYQVECKWTEHTWTIFRRFSQFDELDGVISSAMRPNYTLPSKTLKKHFEEDFVEKRREELDVYMQGCSIRLEQIMAYPKTRKQWFKFIRPAQLGDLRCPQFSFDIFATPGDKGF